MKKITPQALDHVHASTNIGAQNTHPNTQIKKMTLIAVVDPKEKAAAQDAPNRFFEPDGWEIGAVIFFIVSVLMILLMLKAGKGKNYGD